MRAGTVLAALSLLLMAFSMSDATDDKKEEKKETKGIKIKVRAWDAAGKKFLDPAEVDARRVELKGNVYFFVPVKQAVGTGQPVRGSEITDATDGTVYIVKNGSSTGMGEYQATVEKKPKP